MEYIEQVEKIYKYFEFNLELNLLRLVVNMKHNFNNDLNLIGCFLKDYLTVAEDKKIADDEDLYDEFILYFERETSGFPKEYIVNNIVKYSKYYLAIAFEDFKDDDILIAVSTVNSCFALEYYPVIMKILDKYYSGKISHDKFKILLDSVVDTVIKNFEDYEILEIQPHELEEQIWNAAGKKSRMQERKFA